MDEPSFDHDRLDVYRLSIEYVAFSCGIAKNLAGLNRAARDQWLRAAQSIPRNIAEGNGKQSLKDKNRFFGEPRGTGVISEVGGSGMLAGSSHSASGTYGLV